jgi:hypothetical protein
MSSPISAMIAWASSGPIPVISSSRAAAGSTAAPGPVPADGPVLPSASTPRAAGIAASSSPIRAVSLLICGGAGDEVAGYVREALVGVAAVVAQQSEGLVHVDAEALGEFAFWPAR